MRTWLAAAALLVALSGCTAVVDGTGTVRIDDTVWRIRGPDTPAGSRVRIVQADGASLTVALV